MINIRPYRIPEFKRANIVHIDELLLQQCAYYPRPSTFGKPSPCIYCTFDFPNDNCRRAHILTDTRIGGCELCHHYGRKVYNIHDHHFCKSCLRQIIDRAKLLRNNQQEGGDI